MTRLALVVTSMEAVHPSPNEEAQAPASSSSSSSRFSPELLLNWCCSGLRPYLLLFLLCLLLFLPGISSLPPTDRDEARYVQATKQMLESGDFVRIRVQQTPREKKPVGIHWLQAAAAYPFGGSTAPLWAYRLPSFLSATLAILLTFSIGSHLLTRRAAFIGAVILASSLLVVAEAHLAKTDATLLLTVVAAVGTLLKGFAIAPLSRREAIFFWIALAGGTLIKGPVLPGLAATTGVALLILSRQSRRAALVSLRPLVGIPLFVALVAPWVIAISIVSEGGFFARAFAGDIAPKLTGVHESHGGFPGYYLSMLLVTFWPWSLGLVPALATAWRSRNDPRVRALGAWLIPGLLVIELVPTKLPHYVLPLFPPLALLVGNLLSGESQPTPAPPGRLSAIITVLWVVVTAALGISCVALSAAFGPRTLLASLPLLTVLTALVHRVWSRRAHYPGRHAAHLLLAASTTYILFFGGLFPGLDSFWISRSLKQELSQLPIPTPSSIVIAGYQEPSAVFLLGTGITLTDGAGAAGALRDGSAQVAVVEERQLGPFRDALGECAVGLTASQPINGFNYSKGKYMSLHPFWRTTACPADAAPQTDDPAATR